MGGRRKQDGGSRSENDRRGREADVEGRETSQRNSRLHSEVEDVMGSGPSREGNDDGGDEVYQVGSPASTPLILQDGEPDSM